MRDVRRAIRRAAVAALACLAMSACARTDTPGVAAAAEKVSFDEDVRPLFSDRCFACHGPDANKRQANLRLDVRASALAARKGVRAIVPGDVEDSELVRRIQSTDPEYRMPPPESKKSLSAAEIDVLTRWVAEGAEYQEHWAYRPLVRPAPPQVRDSRWPINDIDRFVLARLEREGIAPSPEASPVTLVRRLSFDLLGLPPPPAEVAAFTAANYSALVDRLLASPHYGERMAMYWLDLVRFADTNGYNEDQHRNIFPYRDYVINAFNANEPFDDFTIEQLAGDLLPEPTVWQRVASGYNRLNKVSTENGSQPKEFVATYAADRVRTTAAVWMGATLGCAQCHDHKFDPYTMKDFYSFAAFFADIEEQPVPRLGRIAQPPEVAVPSAAGEVLLAKLAAQRRQVEEALKEARSRESAALETEYARWQRAESPPAEGVLPAPPLRPTADALGEGVVTEADGKILLIRPEEGAARRVERAFATDEADLEFQLDLDELAFPESETASVSSISWRVGHGAAGRGLYVNIAREPGAEVKLRASCDRSSEVQIAGLGAAEGLHSLSVLAVWEGARRMWRVSFGTNGDPPDTPVDAEPLLESIASVPAEWNESVLVKGLDVLDLAKQLEENQRSAAGLGARVVAAPIRPRDVLASPAPAIALLRALKPDERSAEQEKELREYFFAHSPRLRDLAEKKAALDLRERVMTRSFPTSLTTVATKPHVTRILPRGNWQDDSGEIVEPAVPAFLPPLPAGVKADRLALARWLVTEASPLTARVLVNRLWKLFFGTGIVTTLDDLGSQGGRPSHPQLLDWLAAELVESGWDVRHVIRLIVNSRTYRQASFERPDLRDVDPENRLLARQSSFRLDAEMIRDNALAASGLLSETVGGRSVKPYQPEGYWDGVSKVIPGSAAARWVPSRGDQQYRRGLYTYWKRTFLHPMLLAFDAPTREECVAERTRSNTPLQSLVLLNDPTFVEAARVLAERGEERGGETAAERIAWIYERVLSHEPEPAVATTLEDLYAKHLREYRDDPAAATSLLSVGAAPAADPAAAPEVAALTSVSRTVLNLHETITRY